MRKATSPFRKEARPADASCYPITSSRFGKCQCQCRFALCFFFRKFPSSHIYVVVRLPSSSVPFFGSFRFRYDLALVPDLDAYTFRGRVDILFRVDKTKLTEDNSKVVTLHAKELAFVSAEYRKVVDVVADDKGGGSGKDSAASAAGAASAATVKASQINVNVKATTVDFVFDEPIASADGEDDAKIVLTIEYVGFLNNQMAGFYRSSYQDVSGQSKIMASTQFESLDARRAFPCVDEPAAKAVFRLKMTIPSNLRCLSNMPESSSVSNQDGKTKTVSYMDSPKMSTYLLAFVVGECDSVHDLTSHGVSVTVYAPPGKSANGKFALDVALRALDAYDDFFGVPYPLPKLDMVAVPEFAAVRTRVFLCLFFLLLLFFLSTFLLRTVIAFDRIQSNSLFLFAYVNIHFCAVLYRARWR